jgi:PAS domain S-box-containing protein
LTDAERTTPGEARLHAVIEASPDAILEVDLDTRVRLWNPAAERLFGWTGAEAIGRPPPFVPESLRGEFEDLVGQVRSGRAYTGIETVRVRKDGTLLDVEVSAAPVRDPAGNVTSHVVVFRDITLRKQQERELRRLNEELAAQLAELAASRARIVEAADAERRRLERNLHDGAQQRLVTLALTLRLAAGRIDADPPAARALVASAADDLAVALDELRELARGIHPAVLTEHGLERALEALAFRAPLPVEIATTPGERLPEALEAAAYYLVAEAMTNAAKYAGASVVTVSVARADGHAVVEIADDGCGGADASRGSGLRGLADRIEALHGRFDVSSPPGAGTRITATLPLG